MSSDCHHILYSVTDPLQDRDRLSVKSDKASAVRSTVPFTLQDGTMPWSRSLGARSHTWHLPLTEIAGLVTPVKHSLG